MRHRFLAVVSVLAGMAVAGCGGGAAEQTPTTQQTHPEQSTSANKASTPPRSGPAKTTDIADKCGVVTDAQWKGFGADRPPRQLDSNGRPGCKYQKGEAGATGWSVFVAVDGKTSFNDEVNKRRKPDRSTDLGGYPAVEYADSTGCVLYANTSDHGFLIANAGKTSPDDPGVDLCQQAEKFAQAAIQNLPNA